MTSTTSTPRRREGRPGRSLDDPSGCRCERARRRAPAVVGRGRARWFARLALPAFLATVGAGCYGFSGGGGLPSHIQTAYVEPVTNETTRFGLSETLTQMLLDVSRERLGLRLSSESEADAMVRATITRYNDDAVNFQAREGVGADVFQRRVTVSARVEILDLGRREVVWTSSSVSGQGEYDPESETEEEGLQVALENLVQKIVDGAQSQW